jgi:hypothetical protein
MEPSLGNAQKNREVRGMFYDIQKIDAFINKRTTRYVGKVVRSESCLLLVLYQITVLLSRSGFL